ncbi:hypothetical protein JW935_15545 [candidate division KSB1 bacterium]|nr:hypothetical protein [candidate division KSB1 bacterium]
MTKKTVMAFGEVLWDMLPGKTILGGAPFNFIYRIKTLGDTGLMVSRLGTDDLGGRAFEKIADLGLNTMLIQQDTEHPTGTVKVFFDEQKNPDYYIIPGVAYDYIELTENLIKAAKNIDCLCFGTLAQRNSGAQNTLKYLLENTPRAVKFLDINLRKECYTPDSVEFSLQHADILKLNDDEVTGVAETTGIKYKDIPDFCSKVIDRFNLDYCLVTFAKDGAFAASKDQAVYDPGYRIRLEDSLGSGDAFSAAFVHKILRGADVAEACRFGNILGALVATKAGATGLVKQQEIEELHGKTERNVLHEYKQYIPKAL